MGLVLKDVFDTFGQDALGIVIILALLTVFMAIAEIWRHFLKPPVEWTRKFVHFFSGLVVACFPWLLSSAMSVLVIALVMLFVLTLTKEFGMLKSVHSVSRKSHGDVYYLLAVIALFLHLSGSP